MIRNEQEFLNRKFSLEKVTILNNGKLKLNSQFGVTIISPFSMELGASLEIASNIKFPVILDYPFIFTKMYGEEIDIGDWEGLNVTELIFKSSNNVLYCKSFCNNFATLFVLHNNNQIWKDSRQHTYIYCHPKEAMTLDSLFQMVVLSINRYQFIDDWTIHFFDENNEVALEFEADLNFAYGSKIPFTVLPNGNVGIRTNNPSEKLAVKGNIVSSEVEIIALDSIPDYVFNPGYQLLSLKEVESFVKQNHHLPETPSEKDFAEKGMDFGELNLLLLKKIEELTLYVIEHQNDLNEIRKSLIRK